MDEYTSNTEPDEGVQPPASSGSGPLSVSLSTAVGLVFSVIGLFIGSRPISDNSFLTHLATGNLSRSLGHIPTVDSYSYTAPGQVWTVQSWFVSLVYSHLGDIAEGSAIRLVNGFLVGAVVALLWQLTVPARPLLSRVILMGPVLVVGASQWTPRPLLVGVLGFVVVLSVLQQQMSPRWLVPMMWIWVNSHGSFPLAFVLIGAFGVGQLLDDRAARQLSWKLPAVEAKALAWTCAGLVCAMVNPLGPRLLVFPIELLAKQEALENVAEWQAPGFESPMDLMFLGLMVALGCAARSGARWRLLVPGVVFSIAGLLAVRNVGAAAIVLTVAIAPSIRMRGSIRGHEQGLIAKALGAVAIAIAIAWSVSIVQTGPLVLDAYPEEAVDWLEDRGLVAQPGVNIVQRDYVGNYLDFRFGDEARIFVDDRFDFFPQQVLDDHVALLGGGGGDYSEILQRYDTNVVLWENDGGLAAWLRESDAWTIAFESDDWLVALPS